MTALRALFILTSLMALTDFVGSSVFLPASAESEPEHGTGNPDWYYGDGTGDLRLNVNDDWVGCPTRHGMSQSLDLCEEKPSQNDAVAFNMLRKLLADGVTNRERLCDIDAAVMRTQPSCKASARYGDLLAVSDLMRLLARNWTEQQAFSRADHLYEQAYGMLQRADGDVYGSIAVLKDWATLKLRLGEWQRAKEIAERATAIARQAYKSSEFPSELLVASLRFQSRTLKALGLESEARVADREVHTLVALNDLTGKAWLFDYLSPRLWPTLEHVADKVRNLSSDAKVGLRSMDAGDDRFSLSIVLSDDLSFTRHVAIDLKCDANDKRSWEIIIAERRNRKICRSQVTKKSREGSRILKYGPSIEFETSNKENARRKLDEWVVETVKFVHDNTDFAVSELRSRSD